MNKMANRGAAGANSLDNDVDVDSCVLVVGNDRERLELVAATLGPFTDNTHILSTQDELSPGTDFENCHLLILTDATVNSLSRLDEVASKVHDSVLTLGCFPRAEFKSALKRLDDRIDDIIFDLEELEDRIPFILQRIEIRETSQKQYRAIFETIVDGIVTIDERGKITAFNSAAESIFGYTSVEIIGRSISMLMPQPYSAEHASYVQEYLQTGERHVIGIGREVVGVRKNGDSFPMELAVSEVRSEGRMLFTGVVRDITERRALEHEILRISDQERRRIGHDLHDGLGQMLTGIGLIAQNLTHRLENEESECADDMLEITELIKEADRSARSLSRGMVPVELGELGLSNALQSLVRNAEKLFGISCSLENTGNIPIRDISAATNLYRIVQEAVSNAVKHGKSSHVHVVLSSRERRIHLTVRDDGIGFPDKLPADRGMGIRIMKYRARVLGATLEINKGARGGTVVSCILPV